MYIGGYICYFTNLLEYVTTNSKERERKKYFFFKYILQILLQGRRDNPIHEVAFNELIENLKERNTIWSNMNENSDRNH